MTELLKKAFAEASKLPQDRQDAIAALLLAELESDRQWDSAFSRSQQALASLADEALAEHERGETEELDPSNL